MTVHMMLTDIKEYSLRLNIVLDCTMNNHITAGKATLPKAVLSTVKIFAVYPIEVQVGPGTSVVSY